MIPGTGSRSPPQKFEVISASQVGDPWQQGLTWSITKGKEKYTLTMRCGMMGELFDEPPFVVSSRAIPKSPSQKCYSN